MRMGGACVCVGVGVFLKRTVVPHECVLPFPVVVVSIPTVAVHVLSYSSSSSRVPLHVRYRHRRRHPRRGAEW